VIRPSTSIRKKYGLLTAYSGSFGTRLSTHGEAAGWVTSTGAFA
jgi:hypothetical protein